MTSAVQSNFLASFELMNQADRNSAWNAMSLDEKRALVEERVLVLAGEFVQHTRGLVGKKNQFLEAMGISARHACVCYSHDELEAGVSLFLEEKEMPALSIRILDALKEKRFDGFAYDSGRFRFESV